MRLNTLITYFGSNYLYTNSEIITVNKLLQYLVDENSCQGTYDARLLIESAKKSFPNLI